jgi:hypothetical protein
MDVCSCAILTAVLGSSVCVTALSVTHGRAEAIAEQVQQDPLLPQTAPLNRHPSTLLWLLPDDPAALRHYALLYQCFEGEARNAHYRASSCQRDASTAYIAVHLDRQRRRMRRRWHRLSRFSVCHLASSDNTYQRCPSCRPASPPRPRTCHQARQRSR